MKMSKEIVDARRKRIMEKIQIQGKVNVEELAKELNVAPLTIRRDLQYWEDMGAVIRYYGGARLIQSFVDNDQIKDNNEPYKHAIAKYAANLVEEGDTIFINTSSTALLMLRYIHDKHVTVITNNGKALFIDHDPKITVVLTGGEIRYPKESMVGDFALNNVNRVSADKSFLGCSGIDAEIGMTTAILPEVSINEAMISRCTGKKILLADATKVANIHQFSVAKADVFDLLITDFRVQKEQLEDFKYTSLAIQTVHPFYGYQSIDQQR